jgi:glycosyltransferase involved in cell wall biosynthesis
LSNVLRVQILQPVVPAYRVPLFEALSNLPDLEIQVHAADRAGELKSANYAYQRATIRELAGGRLFWQSTRLSEPAPDVLVVSGNARVLSNYPLMLRAKRKAASVVWWGQGWSVGSSELGAWTRAHLSRLADVALLYNDAEIDLFAGYGFPPKRLVATNNTIDTREVKRIRALWDNERLEAFKTRHRLEGPVFLCCGRLVRSKRLQLAITALSRVHAAGGRFSFVLIGDGPEKAELERAAARSNLSSYIHFVGEEWQEESLAPWFLSARALLHPGPLGLGLLHAFAYGLPVITHAERRHHGPEIHALRDNENGLLFHEDDADDLARVIGIALSDQASMRRLAECALKTVEASYSFENMVARYHAALLLSREIQRERRGRAE